MKWIKGVWDGSDDMLFVNPEYITTIDTGRQLLWAQDCDVAVRYDEEDYPLILKLIGRTEAEALDKQQEGGTKGGKESKTNKVSKV